MKRTNYPPMADKNAWQELLRRKYRSYPIAILLLFMVVSFPFWLITVFAEHFEAIDAVLAEREDA